VKNKWMAEHNVLGKSGEDAAVAYLEREDYTIRHRNWRYKHLEMDIVAVKDNEVIFAEVKTRQSDEYGEPYDAVNPKKMRNLIRAADTYIKLYQLDNPIRFDIISITGGMGNFKIEHIKEAFYPTINKNL
jgi:putative endonuclease